MQRLVVTYEFVIAVVNAGVVASGFGLSEGVGGVFRGRVVGPAGLEPATNGL